MTAVALGLFAACCWAALDLIARHHAPRIGPFRIAFWGILIAGALMTLWFGIRGWPAVSREGLALSLVMGVAYAAGAGGLFKAFSLGPISIVSPITECYPVIVVAWGVIGGLRPGPLQWLALPVVFLGIWLVARFAPNAGKTSTVSEGDYGRLYAWCAVSAAGFAIATILSQTAAPVAGEVETVWISRATAALTVAPFLLGERHLAIRGSVQWGAVAVLGILDAAGIVAIAAAGHLPAKEFAVVAGASYGAIGVGLAAIVLKERVSPPQWGGVALICLAIAALAAPG